VIGGQKWGVILGMPWLERHNPEIDWKTGEVKMTRCPEECGKVFGKKQSERMPTRKLWDHAIEMKEGFVPRKGKVYPLSREEREEVRVFMKEQLRKGYIRPSKSPQMAPVFFVGKKDGKKRMVQDYHYLNEWTIKNNYPLPLISDVLENIGTKKVFTKMDLR